MPTPSPGCPPPNRSPSKPQLILPPRSCDSHCHVFGPHDRFPYAEDRPFTPHDVPKERLMALHDMLGLERTVIVQSTCHGSDHAVLLDALAAGSGAHRGVALIDASTSEEELDELDAAGVRGFRMHFMGHLGDAPSRREVERLISRVADRGWHPEVHLSGNGVLDHAELLASLAVPVVVDHMARVDLRESPDGTETPAVHALLDLLENDHVWVKVSGIDRLSTQGPPYDDAVALAAQLVAHAPARVVWGTDFPHPNITGTPPDEGVLVDRLADIAPDPAALERLMVQNPARLYGFDD